MIICGLDFEATSLDVKEARIIEIGAVLWDTELQVPVKILCTLVDPMVEVPEETTALTGITSDMIQTYGISEEKAVGGLAGLMFESEYCMAHNGAIYDYPLWKNTLERMGRTADPSGTWIDSRTDIKMPESIVTRNLKYLAAEFGFINPFPHRALFDVLTMFKIASQFKWEDIIARSKEPTLYVQAIVSFDEKELAKARGYRWYAPTKLWWKEFKASDYATDKLECGFRTQLLDKAPE
jgi:DNA polymerase-3 subunit epsilon